MSKEQFYIDWCKDTYGKVKVGGSWAVPRSGLIFNKTEIGYELATVMPYTDDIAMGAYLHADVPQSAEELRAYQRKDFNIIQKYHKLAGLEVTDPKGLLIGALDEYGYPADWPKCPGCGRPAMDGHITCGRAECDEGKKRFA